MTAIKKPSPPAKARQRFEVDPAVEAAIRDAAQRADSADDEARRLYPDFEGETERLRDAIDGALFRTRNPNFSVEEMWGKYVDSGRNDSNVKEVRRRQEAFRAAISSADERRRLAIAELEELVVPLGKRFNETTSAAHEVLVAEVAAGIRPFCVSDEEAEELAPIFRRSQIASEIIGDWGRQYSWPAKGRCLLNDIRRFNDL